MRLFLVVNKETGEMESFCSVCSFNGIGDTDNPDIIQSDENHTIVEITQEEMDAMAASLISNEETREVKYGAKLDPKKMKPALSEREKVEVPIEAEGIGGKEIIAYDEKPVGIVVERELVAS